MSVEKEENELSSWLSTYGLITEERILEKYKIRLPRADLLLAMKNPHSFYHRIIRVPLKNVLNGIIKQQARDYQIYSQKLFIDYLISGESGKSEESPGGTTREDLEIERKKLIEMTEAFQREEVAHNQLIASCQQTLISQSAAWETKIKEGAKKIKKRLQDEGLALSEDTISRALIFLLIQIEPQQRISNDNWQAVEQLLTQVLSAQQRQIFIEQIHFFNESSEDLNSTLDALLEQTSTMSLILKKYRIDFYAFILRVTDLIKLLPEYHNNQAQTEENRQSLYFDSKIGE